MPTLHEVTQGTKKILLWSSLLIVAILILVGGVRFGKALKEFFSPTPPPPPTVLFGKIQKPLFPQSQSSSSYTYSIDTLTGTFPTLPDRVNVYKIVEEQPSLLAIPRAQQKVKPLGFTLPPTQLSEKILQWINETPPSKKLVLNIFSQNFSYFTDYLSDPEVLSAERIPKKEAAVETAQSFISSLFFPSDIDTQKTKITLFSLEGSLLVPATSQSNTKVLRIDFYQNDVGKIPIYYPTYPFSNTYALVSSSSKTMEGKIIEANSYHQDIDTASLSTYPIKTAEEAFRNLQKGSAYIAHYPDTKRQIAIKDIKLGYYVGKEPQKFLIPIIVFEGNNEFTAFVLAIKDTWMN